ncbi:MAG: YHS domain-containing protein [Saprospiraceae bacterium]|nr:YHS domain-containing protein [Saprospiraceae bacterium]
MKFAKSVICLLLAFNWTLSSVTAQTEASPYNTDDSKIALQGYSPISYLELGLAQRGTKAYKSEHEGLKYYFTSAEQKSKFDAAPEKYLPQFGGWCATGIAVGAKFRTDPHKFLVKNGKYYLFLYDLEVDAKELWLSDEKGMEAKANKNWEQM